MRYLLPILLGLMVLGCSLPKAHDPNLAKQAQDPLSRRGPARRPSRTAPCGRTR